MAIDSGLVSIQEEKKGDVLILHLKGRLDAVSSPATEKKVLDFINSGEIKVVLDFNGIEYMSSAGMRMLLATSKKLKVFSGKLIVCSVTPTVMDILKMSGFDNILDLSNNINDALKKF